MSQLKRTPLFDAHVAAGGTMVDFGGWEMPIQYPTGIVGEHLQTRNGCGIFDVSHMGRLIVEGPDRVKFLQKVLTSNVEKLVPGRAQYCIISDENGYAVDDAYLYMFVEEKYLLIVNASNTDKDLAHFERYLPEFDCKITNVTDVYSSIAVQGPETDRILMLMSGGAPITGPKKNDLGTVILEGHTVQASRTGYTGEPIGYELFIPASEVNWLWNRLIELGAHPIALGARDTLRLEAGLPLYGHEMGLDASGAEMPIFAVSLARFAVNFAEQKGDFVGKAALEAQKSFVEKKIVAIRLVDRGVMRAGMEVYRGVEHIGWVTSGTMVPFYEFDGEEPTDKTGKRSIGFAYVKSDVAVGDTVQIDVRGKRLKAAVVQRHMRQDLPPYGRAEV